MQALTPPPKGGAYVELGSNIHGLEHWKGAEYSECANSERGWNQQKWVVRTGFEGGSAVERAAAEVVNIGHW